MRKYGLSREQRSHLIRSTGGSSRFEDIEKILRASDYEDRLDDRIHPKARREAYVVQSKCETPTSSSIDALSDSASEEAFQVAVESESQGSGTEEELAEIYEVQKKAKRDFKKNFRTYKESKKKVRELKKARQPYMPVVALNPDSAQAAGSSSVQNVSKPPRYEKKIFDKKSKDSSKKKPPRKEDAHLVEIAGASEFITEFAYAVLETLPLGCDWRRRVIGEGNCRLLDAL